MTDPSDQTLAAVLSASDEGATIATIAARVPIGAGRIYALLREHRPDRQRSPRRRTSELAPKVLGLLAAGIKPSRVAALCECTRQYVYRIQKESASGIA